ncbi:MAG: hypothetical protein ACRD6U_08385 [Nitrososphaeraceae archaeon]
MFNLFSIFYEIGEVFELLKKKDVPTQIKFSDSKSNNTIEILISVPHNNEINFNIKSYKNKNQINIIQLDKYSILFFKIQYYQYIKQLLSMERIPVSNSQKKYSEFIQNIFSFFNIVPKLINEYKIHPILFFYPFTLLNIYSIDGYNNNIVSRTIMKSLDKINIINSSYLDKAHILVEIHNLNVLLIDSIFQNRIRLILRMFTLGTKFFIRIVRIYLFIIGIILNLALFITKIPQISEINLSEIILQNLGSLYDLIILPNLGFIIVNITISILWLLAPRIISSIITFSLQTSNKVNQRNKKNNSTE